jgi:ketosteroid isomerase-like protein
MKVKIIFALFLFLLFFVSPAAAQSKQIDEVLRTVRQYDDAWNKKDVAAVSRILSADYVYFDSKGGNQTLQQTLDFLKSPKYNLVFAERSEIRTFRTGETVIVSSRWKGKGTYDAEEIDDDQRCGQIFVKNGKAWKLAAEHCVQIAAK